MLSDSFPITVIDDIVFEVETKMVTKTEGDYDIGANPSAEAADEGFEKSSETVNNLVDAMRLAETVFDKKSFMGYIKAYMKKVLEYLKEKNPERVPIFQEKIQGFVSIIRGKCVTDSWQSRTYVIVSQNENEYTEKLCQDLPYSLLYAFLEATGLNIDVRPRNSAHLNCQNNQQNFRRRKDENRW